MDDVVIAVMGATGSGKSSFINLLTGDTSAAIGSSLESETAEVFPICFTDRVTGRNVTVVDTPGFDDSRQGVTDTDILTEIAKYMLIAYNADRKLTGLIYVQRISDPRFSGQQRKNLRMFEKLCGTNTLKNVIVLTTFWDQVGLEIGEDRERQMQSKFFKGVVDGGARFMRHDRTAASAHAVLSYVLAELAPVVTQIQIEMGVEGRALVDTSAGMVQQEEIERVIAKHREEVSSLKAEIETVKESNAAARRELEEEKAELQRQLGIWEKEKAELKSGFQEQSAKWADESAALRENMERESSARRMLEADLADARANHETMRQDQQRLLAEQTNSSQLKEEYGRMEERLRNSERRLQEQEERQRQQQQQRHKRSGGFCIVC